MGLTAVSHTANLCTKILDFRGSGSSIILISRGGIPWPIGNFPEILSQRILAGRFLVGRLCVLRIHGVRITGPRNSGSSLHPGEFSLLEVMHRLGSNPQIPRFLLRGKHKCWKQSLAWIVIQCVFQLFLITTIPF